MIELQNIVRQLEQGEIPLEASLKQYEAGIALARQCQEMLTLAEQKVTLLSKTAGEPGLQDDA